MRKAQPIVLAFFAAAALMLSPKVARAHAHLKSSEPAAGSTVHTLSRVRLVFSEDPVLAMSRFHLVSSAGDTIELGALRVDSADAHAMLADVLGSIGAGKYELHWAVAARDGHASQGTFSFSVDSGPASTAVTQTPLAVSAAPPANRLLVTSVPAKMAEQTSTELSSVLARILAFVSIFLVVGTVTFRLFVLARSGSVEDAPFIDVASTNAATFGMTAALGVLLSSLLKIANESAAMAEVPLRAMMLQSVWGWSIIASIAAALVALFGFWRIHTTHGYARNFWWRMILLMSIVLVITPALGGHAIGSDRDWITVPTDIIHVAAGSMWLGTLAAILIVGISAAFKAPDIVSPGVRVAGLINAFSPMALTCGALVVATGLIAAIIHLPTVNALWTTQYGSALFRKLIFVGLLFLTGAWNWQRMKPRLNTDEAIGTLRRSATIEVLFATVVLVFTATLVGLALPD